MKLIDIPKSAMLELTYKCNFKCKFCYCPWESSESLHLYEKREELSPDSWLRIIRLLKSYGVRRIGLSGGEPLAKNGLLYILEAINSDDILKEDMKFSLITNGTLLREEFVPIFKALRMELGISLPGLKTYSFHTSIEDMRFDAVLNWIARLSKEGIIVHLNVTATRKNLFELSDIIIQGFSAGAHSLSLSRFVAGGRGYDFRDDISLVDSDVIKMLDITENTLRLLNKSGILMSKLPICSLPTDRLYRNVRISSLCGAAKRTFTIDPSGYIRVCTQSSKRVGHIFSDTLIEDRSYWDCYAKNKHKVPGMCVNCIHIETCDFGCIEKWNVIM